MRLAPSFGDVSERELVGYLLRASGQDGDGAVNPSPILDLLRLRHISLDFPNELPEAVHPGREQPRALLSFPERVIATDSNLREQRARFSTFHEIGHYVLPEHVEAIVLCTERDLSPGARSVRAREANSFAAELMFHGTCFTLDANTKEACAATIKELAQKYRASFESTARRLVEKSIRPRMLVVFESIADDRRIDISEPPQWRVKYSIASRSFSLDFFTRVAGDLDGRDVAAILTPGRDIAESISKEETIPLPDGTEATFHAEYFTNHRAVFCLLRPVRSAL